MARHIHGRIEFSQQLSLDAALDVFVALVRGRSATGGGPLPHAHLSQALFLVGPDPIPLAVAVAPDNYFDASGNGTPDTLVFTVYIRALPSTIYQNADFSVLVMEP